MAPDDTRADDEVEEEADRRNGEPGPAEGEGDAQLAAADLDHHDDELDQHPDPGRLPSDTDVQAERQEPLS